ncbi:hypothetical protein BZK31_12375 [Pseudomonas floridensis]|uniref:RHS repeat-associated core domain-containing protein n=1 Tax=Pseudomonas floridensis TaxID=1958950 RepID=A0A1X0N7U0_9PSED|nr:RHS repeat-associated core domain-containing protein [Pseudomonas floridensis]ORC59030.1 hypothetical protein BZK31_12375 [Pseudomonas floridensis]
MPGLTSLGVYRYDAMDRLACCMPAVRETIRRFYRQGHLANELEGAIGHTLLRAEGHLLALACQPVNDTHSDLLATDRANSVSHSVNAQTHQAFSYTPYGSSATERPSGMPAFTGLITDPVTGHYLLGNGTRAFNPVLRRFNSPDPFSPFGEGGLNAYAYCQGDPVNYTDPSGRFPIGALGVAAVWLKKTLFMPIAKKNGMTDEDGIAQTIRKALERNKAAPRKMTPARTYLDNATRQLDRNSPFVQKLVSVNLNLASHGDTNLTYQQAVNYAALAKQVSRGKISNATAHIYAASMWAHKLRTEGQSPSSLVGLAFNLAGAMASGTIDHALLKTGAAIRKGSGH